MAVTLEDSNVQHLLHSEVSALAVNAG